MKIRRNPFVMAATWLILSNHLLASDYVNKLDSGELEGFAIKGTQLKSKYQNGCNADNTAGLISTSGDSFTLIFDEFYAELEKEDDSSVTTCAVEVNFEVPPGRRMGLESLDLRAYASLDEGVRAKVSGKYFFPDSGTATLASRDLDGAFDDSFLLEINGPSRKNIVFSPCGGGSKKAMILTTIRMDKERRYEDATGLVSVDSLDAYFSRGEIKDIGIRKGLIQEYKIKWERCLELFDPAKWCRESGECQLEEFDDLTYQNTREEARDLKDLARDVKESFKDDMRKLKNKLERRYGEDSLQYKQYLEMEPIYDNLIQKIRDKAFDIADKYKEGKGFRVHRKTLIEYIDTVTNMRDRKKEDTWIWFSDSTEDSIRDLDKLIHKIRED